MSDYLKRKKEEEERAKLAQKAGSGNMNVNGQTLEEWRRNKSAAPSIAPAKDNEPRNIYGQTLSEYRQMRNEGGKLNDLQKWQGESENLLRQYSEYSRSGQYQTKEQHDDFAKKIQKQLESTMSLKGKYKDSIGAIDDISARLSGAMSDNDEGLKYFSQWEDDETYKQFLKYQEDAEQSEKESAEKKKQYESMEIPKYQQRFTNKNINPMHSQNAAGLGKPQNLRTNEEKILADAQEKSEWQAQNRTKRDQEYAHILNRASEVSKKGDFKEKSKYIKSGNMWTADTDYEYINDSELSPKYTMQDGNGDLTKQEKKGYDYITEEERAVFNYIYQTEGKKNAKKYLGALNLMERMGKSELEQSEQYAKEKPVQASVTTVLSNLANAGQGFAEGVIGNTSGYGIDINSYGNIQRRASNQIRETVAEGVNSPIGKFLYQTGMSMADSVAAQVAASGLAMLGLPPVLASSGILMSNAATDGMISAKERGVSDDQALMTGLAQGAAEWVFEAVSLGNLQALKEMPANSVNQVVKNIIKQGGVEGSEEVFTSVANAVTDRLINAEYSELNLLKENYISQGYSEEEAEKLVAGDFAKQLGMDFLGGATSGGFMSGGISAINYMTNRNTENPGENEAVAEETETLPEETETLLEGTETLPEETETLLEGTETLPGKNEEIAGSETLSKEDSREEIPWEEAKMYSGEQGQELANTENPEVAPAQQIETKETKKNESAAQMIDTILEYGQVDDEVAVAVVKNDAAKMVLEKKTGIQIKGTEEQQKNTVKEVVKIYGERNGSTITKQQSAPVVAPDKQNATVKGKGVEIIGITSERGSNPKFKASDGSSYTLEEVDFHEEEAKKLYANAAQISMVANDEIANSFVENYKPEFSVPYYSKGFDLFYSAGRMGIPFETSKTTLSAFVKATNEDAMKNAWELAFSTKQKEDSTVTVKKQTQKRKGTGSYEDQTRNLNIHATIQTLVANRTGIDIKRVAEMENDANAMFIPSMMQMVISEKAENEYAALLHELGEFGLAYNRQEMKELQEIFIRYWAEKNGIKGIDDLGEIVRRYQRRYAEVEGSKTVEQAMDEIVNDALAGLFSSDEGVDQFTEWLQSESGYSKNEQKTIVQRLLDVIDNIAKYLKNLIKDSNVSIVARKAAELEMKRAQELRKKFLEVLEGAIENANTKGEYTAEDNTKYSLYLKEEDIPEYLKAGSRKNKNRQKRYEEGKQIIISSENDFDAYVRSSIAGNPDHMVAYGRVEDRLAEDIKKVSNGMIDVTGEYLELLSEDLQHAYDEHATAKEAGDLDMSIDDLLEALKKVNQAQVVKAVEHKAGDQRVTLGIKANDGVMMLIELVSKSAGSLRLKTGWKISYDKYLTKYKSSSSSAGNRSSTNTARDDTASNNIVSNDSKNASENKKFSLKEPIEETKDLVAVHNLTESKLLKTLELGAFPMPSIAVTKAELGHSNFGDITMVFRKDTIDPKNKKNKVYGADAWTPTFPRVEYEADIERIRKIQKELQKYEVPGRFAGEARSFLSAMEYNLDSYGGEQGVIERARESMGMKQLYLARTGDAVEDIMSEKIETMTENEVDISKEIIKNINGDIVEIAKGSGKSIYENYGDVILKSMKDALLNAGIQEYVIDDILGQYNKFQIVNQLRVARDYYLNGAETKTEEFDYQATRAAINKKIDEEAYEKWLKETFKGVAKKEGLYNGKDLYTPSGNRRSFEATHYPFNVQNIVKAMLAQSDDVRNVSGFNGIKSIRAVAVEDFKNIKQIKNASGKLKNIENDQYEQMNEDLQKRLYDVIGSIIDNSSKRGSGNRFIDMDTVGYMIIDACKRPTAANIRNIMESSRWNCTDEQAKEIATIIKEVQDMPVNMFEAKPQRVVEFGEVAAVLVPDDLSQETKKKIHEAGMLTVEYVSNDEKSRLNALNNLNDIKFSLPEEYEELQRQHENTLRENDIYRHMVDYLERRMESVKGTKISEKNVEKVADKMYRRYKSTASKELFRKNVAELFELMSNGNGKTEDFVYLAEEVLRPVLEQSKDNKQISDYAKEILKYIKSTTVKLDAMQKKEVSYHYTTYNDYRRSLFGRMNFSDKGTELDIVWQEWSEMYPELFDKEISSVDQPVRLAEIIAALKEDYDSEVGFNLEEAVSYAAMELMEEYAKLPEVRNLTALKDDMEMQRNLRKLNETYRQEYEEQLRELKAQNKDKLLRQEAKFRSRMAKSRGDRLESQERKKYKNSIVKSTKEIMKLLETNSDKYHVPEVLKDTTIKFLEGMDFISEKGWNTQDTIQLQNRLNLLYRKFSSEEANADGSGFMQDIDPDFLPTLDGLISMIERSKEIKKIGDMDSQQLKEIAYLVGTLKKTISTVNELIGNKHYKKVSEIGDKTIFHLGTLRAKKHMGKWMKIGDDMLNVHMLDSFSFFEQLGNGAKSIHQELRDGFAKRVWMLEEAQKYMQEAIGETEIKNWTGEKAKLHEFDYRGEKYNITTGQLMNLYVLSKRPQAYNHLMAGKGQASENGGFTIDAKSVVKGQKVTERRVKLSENELKKLLDELTPEQKTMALKMQKFLANNCSEWGNEVSMTLYGYKKFGEKTYWPIKTNDNFNKTNDNNAGIDNTSLYAIRNQGMTKSLVKNASNPLVVGDIFDVFSEHVANMANYNAFVIPLTDAMKWYNYRHVTEEGGVTASVKEEIERAYGASAKKYFLTFIKNVNGEVKKGVASEISNTLTSKYKAAAVGANIRTVVQQPTSYFRALMVMDPKYLVKGAAQKPAIKEMHEHSAIAVWKSWGYFETGLGQSVKQVLTGEGTATEKIVEAGMWGAGKADDITWGFLWNAVKEEVKDKNKDIDTSSEEYIKLVSKRFDEVIDQTQVVDTVLHRSQIMRSENGAVKMAVAFMSEPTKSYNLMHSAVRKTVENNTKENRKEVAKRATVYALTGVMTAVAASFVDAFRDDDEEKEWAEKYVENLWKNVGDNLNPISDIPYLKELASFWEGYDSSRTDMAGINSLMTAVQQAIKYAQGESKKTLYGIIKGIVRGLSQTTGIPMYNAMRDVESLIEQITFAPIDENKITSKTVRIRLLKAMNQENEKQLQKYLAWYEEQYQKKIGDGKTDKEAKSDLKKSITEQFKEIYQNSTTAEKIKIKNLLLKIKAGGQQLYKDYDWSSWDGK